MAGNADESALRPLHRVEAVAASLRAGELAPDEARGAVVQVAAAVDASLRRLLRDLPSASFEVRLRALDADELRADEVLAELRQHERISMELAAAVHELFEARRRLGQGGEYGGDDAALAARVTGRLEQEIVEAPPAPRPAAAPTATAPADETLAQPEEPFPEPVPRGWRRPWLWAAGVAFLLIVAAVVWWSVPRGRGEMAQGVALFRSGAYADAASHFYRYAQAHPNDLTAHLYLARIHRRLHRYDLAAPELRKALEIAPDDPGVVTELGFLMLDTRHYDQAAARFKDALRLDPENTSAWVGLVRALRDSGQSAAADQVLLHAPDAVRALLAQAPPDTTAP
ncbi:MAG TPA: tetratricopeptide repeat protein [Longimicrobiaceae bacterium]|nr:tetratricopeptide repeat protein [Longimicrobiaceae bacterium]